MRKNSNNLDELVLKNGKTNVCHIPVSNLGFFPHLKIQEFFLQNEEKDRQTKLIKHFFGEIFPDKDLLALWAKKKLIILVLLILRHCWCLVVALVTFSSNLVNFEKN